MEPDNIIELRKKYGIPDAGVASAQPKVDRSAKLDAAWGKPDTTSGSALRSAFEKRGARNEEIKAMDFTEGGQYEVTPAYEKVAKGARQIANFAGGVYDVAKATPLVGDVITAAEDVTSAVAKKGFELAKETKAGKALKFAADKILEQIPEEQKQAVSAKVQEILSMENVQEAMEALGDLTAGIGTVSGAIGASDLVEAGVKKIAKKTSNAVTDFLHVPTPEEIATKNKRATANVETLIKQTDKAMQVNPALAREVAESGAQPSLVEKWAGISPDVKNRIAGKGKQLKEYFDVAHARNNLDTVPTPLEYGARKVEKVVSDMESMVNDTGSKIGKFRQKIATYKANIDDVNAVENSFNNEIGKLNLEIKNGVIRKKPGTITKVNSDAEISALNDLYADLQTVKQSPDLERLIDLRQLFDSKINFAKASRDVSSSLDPLSRSVRSSIANTAKKIVGKSESANVQKYADFMEGLAVLRDFTNKRAGSEFLLKQALSERGRLPREVMQTIKEFTGVDLMDDATMATIATDLIGNTRQKGLFRQELTKAGLDVDAILSGRQGAISTMLDWAKDRVIDKEKQFLKAAGGK